LSESGSGFDANSNNLTKIPIEMFEFKIKFIPVFVYVWELI